MAFMTKTERANSSKSLISLLQSLTGRTTTIELRNELVINGRVEAVDSHMNPLYTASLSNVAYPVLKFGPYSTTVNKATLCKLNGESNEFEQLFIHGNQIRYVHIPEDIDVMKALMKQVRCLLDNSASQTKRKRISRVRLNRHLEEIAAVEAYKLGRGRGITS